MHPGPRRSIDDCQEVVSLKALLESLKGAREAVSLEQVKTILTNMDEKNDVMVTEEGNIFKI